MAGVVESIGDSDGVRRGQSTHGKARPKPGRQIGISAAITGRRNGPRGPHGGDRGSASRREFGSTGCLTSRFMAYENSTCDFYTVPPFGILFLLPVK